MNNNVIEIKEAIAAGERALSSLYVAQEKLNSARGWGMFDLFGGGRCAEGAGEKTRHLLRGL